LFGNRTGVGRTKTSNSNLPRLTGFAWNTSRGSVRSLHGCRVLGPCFFSDRHFIFANTRSFISRHRSLEATTSAPFCLFICRLGCVAGRGPHLFNDGPSRSANSDDELLLSHVALESGNCVGLAGGLPNLPTIRSALGLVRALGTCGLPPISVCRTVRR